MLNKSEEPDYLQEMPLPFVAVCLVRNDAGEPVDFAYVYVNEAMAELEGTTREDLLGTAYYRRFPDGGQGLLAVFEKTIRTGERQYLTFYSKRKDRYLSISTYCPSEGICACVLQDVTDQVDMAAKLREERSLLQRQAARDPLTGLYHVREGRKLIDRELSALSRRGAKCAFFMFDVDDFKQVNDRYGHHSGDGVLRGFADLLTKSFRSADIVFRAGGDEFSAFIADVPDPCVVERICLDIVQGVERLSLKGVSISVSIGVAVGYANQSFESLYRAADKELYGIKRTGKSSYRISDIANAL